MMYQSISHVKAKCAWWECWNKQSITRLRRNTRLVCGLIMLYRYVLDSLRYPSENGNIHATIRFCISKVYYTCARFREGLCMSKALALR